MKTTTLPAATRIEWISARTGTAILGRNNLASLYKAAILRQIRVQIGPNQEVRFNRGDVEQLARWRASHAMPCPVEA